MCTSNFAKIGRHWSQWIGKRICCIIKVRGIRFLCVCVLFIPHLKKKEKKDKIITMELGSGAMLWYLPWRKMVFSLAECCSLFWRKSNSVIGNSLVFVVSAGAVVCNTVTAMSHSVQPEVDTRKERKIIDFLLLSKIKEWIEKKIWPLLLIEYILFKQHAHEVKQHRALYSRSRTSNLRYEKLLHWTVCPRGSTYRVVPLFSPLCYVCIVSLRSNESLDICVYEEKHFLKTLDYAVALLKHLII